MELSHEDIQYAICEHKNISWGLADEYLCAYEQKIRGEYISNLDGHDKQTKYELLDKFGEYLFNSKYSSEKIADLDYDQTVTFSRLEWYQILEEMKSDVEEGIKTS